LVLPDLPGGFPPFEDLMRIVTVVVCSLIAAAPALAQRTQVIPTGMSASATLSPGIRVGDLIFASGQLGSKQGTPMDSTIQGQTRQALENLKAVFEAGGSSMQNVVKCTVFLTSLADFQGMNSVYLTYWPKEPPARSTVVVAALVRADAKTEIECIAAVNK
jgi:2-iminobutanoate/2-iminopropanoate deaminase